ncbi:transglycosylase domain-containing protein [Robertmurraya mangrovi]|uniref:transglycosylase domain-containing protein n=1 Tax=Robertmurraya mangrovi TaxID=3098077 RepID=UPI002ACC343A|nr:transglycosylase domain-containing protein [Bacillus sp. 31A1R]
MRTFTGYMFIFIFLPIFIILISLSLSEASNVQSFHEILDERIELEDSKLSQTSYIKDRNDQIISEIHKPMNRTYLPSDKIPPFLKELFVLAEDQHFYDHLGFDLTAMGRALAINIQSSDIEQGASTITQQLARNLYLNHERSYNRKLSELLYAYEIERTYSKEEILDLYINTIYFQNGAYGIEAAANLYFQKSASKLSKAQLAFLAAIPNNPSYYDPVKNFDRTKKRQERLLKLLSDKGFLNQEEREKLVKEPVTVSLKTRIDKYADYTTYVEVELKELIRESEGFSKRLSNSNDKNKEHIEKELQTRFDEVLGSGIIIHTSLDPLLQERAKQAVKRHLPYTDVEGSATVINHSKNEILAMVGGKNYKKYDFHRAFQGYRQPGSSIKPLLVYAPYIERTQALLSERISADSFCINGYCPKNYGGGTYGMVSLESAFIHSFNTPAVRLLNTIGVEEGFKDLKHFDFNKVSKTDKVLPAAVGGFTYGMTSLEMASAYTTFSNDGSFRQPRAIQKVTDLNGKTLFEWKDKSVQVWSKSTTDKMRTLLNRVVTSGTGRKSYYPTSYIGGKTGTTNDYHDYWFIGLNEELTTGVWVGKDRPSNIKAIETTGPQLLIWREIMSGY